MRWILVLFFLYPLLAQDDVAPKKKVLCVSVPKAGTHLLKKAVRLITNQTGSWIGVGALRNSDVQDALFASDKLLYATHLFAEIDVVKDWDSNRFAKVLLIRDPRDTMVSFVHHLLRRRWPFSKEHVAGNFKTLSWDEQLCRALLLAPFTPKDALHLAVDWLKRPDLFVIRFEDLIGTKGGGSDERQRQVLYALAEHIGSPISWERADEIAGQLFGATWTFRRGQIGEWETSYNEANKALFKELLGQETIELGYASDLNW